MSAPGSDRARRGPAAEQIGGVILAGGLATRMGGGDKGLLSLGGETLLARVVERLGPQVGPMAVNANGDPARFAATGLPVLADSIPGHPGPLAGVLAGLDWAAGQGLSHVVSVAADTPFFPAGLVARLGAACGPDCPIALAAISGPGGRVLRQPTFGLWPVALREDLRAALIAGTRKVVAWTDRHGAASVLFPAHPVDPFFNVNTPDDMAEAERMIAEYGL